MIYSSLQYIYGFLPLSLLIFFAVPKKYRELVLLGLSMVYCFSFSLYFLIFMAAYVILNYTMCRITEYLKSKKSIAEVAFASTVVLDITVLFAFRAPYMNWFAGMIRAPEGVFAVGISLFTLSVTGMLTDVYKGREKAETNIVRYALYVMFFPKLLIGPVMRYSTFRKAMKHRKTGLAEVGAGISVFVKGLAKKAIFADTLFMLYSAVSAPEGGRVPVVNAWLGVGAYMLGMYFELSGLADMGAGTARCFGLHFPACFRYPLFSRRINYFAARWNTPVVNWFRRHITLPLAASAKNGVARSAAFLAGWALMGFWYTFRASGIMAGILFGAAILVENRFRSKSTMKITGVIYTLIISAVCVSVFSLESSSKLIRHFGTLLGSGGFADSSTLYLIREYTFILIAAAYFSSALTHKLIRRISKMKAADKIGLIQPIVIAALLVVCTVLLAGSGSSQQLFLRL